MSESLNRAQDLIDKRCFTRQQAVEEERLQTNIMEVEALLQQQFDENLNGVDGESLRRRYVPIFQELIEIYVVNVKQEVYKWSDDVVAKVTTSNETAISSEIYNEIEEKLQAVIDEVEERLSILTRKKAREIFNQWVEKTRSQVPKCASNLNQRLFREEELLNANAPKYSTVQLRMFERFQDLAAETGSVMVGAYRISFEDDSVCERCKSRADKFHTIPEVLNTPLPDPACSSQKGECRCGWVPVFRELAEHDI